MKRLSATIIVLSLLRIPLSLEGVKNKQSLLSEKERSLDHFINYEDFKNACDVVFDHTTDKNRYFDPVWFREKGKEVMPHQKVISLNKPFDPSLVGPGDLVFVRRPRPFLEHIHPYIKHPYVIVTHGNSSSRFKREYAPALEDPKIIAWFTVHASNNKHPKLHPLPLGIRKLPHFLSKGQKTSLQSFCEAIRTSAKKKKQLVYMNFLDRTHSERMLVKEMFSNKSFCLHEDKVDFETFMYHIAQSKFTLAPRGVGPTDSFRLWESLMVGSIPVIKRTRYMDCSLYEGLPVLIVDNWPMVTETFLRRAYRRMASTTYSSEKLYMRYWIKQMHQARDYFLKNYKHSKNNAHLKPRA